MFKLNLLFFLSLQLFLASSHAATDDFPFCGTINSAAVPVVDAYLAAIDGTTITSKFNASYRLRTASMDRSETKQGSIAFDGQERILGKGGQKLVPWKDIVHNVEIIEERLDGTSKVVGYANVEAEGDAIRLKTIQFRDEFQTLGLATEVLKPLVAQIPPNVPVKLFSAESKTNHYFNSLANKAVLTPGYGQAVRLGGRKNGDAYVSDYLTRHTIENPREPGALWPSLLLSSGFKKFRIEAMSGMDPGTDHQFFIYAEP